MRRRTILFCLLGLLVAGGALPALADVPYTSLAYPLFIDSQNAPYQYAQNGPALAVSQLSGQTVLATAVGSDWRNGVLQPQTTFATAPVQPSGTVSWTEHGLLPGTTGQSPDIVSGGSPAVAWGSGDTVFAVQLGRNANDATNACSTQGPGLYLSVSTNDGATFGQPVLLQAGGLSVSIQDPSVAYDQANGRLYVAYTLVKGCPASGQGSSVRLLSTSDFASSNSRPIVSVADGGPQPQFMRPSVAALPNGNVVVSLYDATAGAVDASVCTTAGATVACAAPTTVDGSATDVAIGNTPIPVLVRPSVAATTTGGSGRVVIAYAKATGLASATVFSATSVDGGARFGAPQRITPSATTGTQFDPSIAIAPDDRADVAYYDSRGLPSGYVVSASSSNAPTAGGTLEAWSVPQAVESTTINSNVSPAQYAQPSLGGRLGIADLPRTSGRAWTLIAWTDTRNQSTPYNEDVYSTVLKRQQYAPVANAFPGAFPVSKNAVTTVPFDGSSAVTQTGFFSDPEADPLTYRIVKNGGVGVATIPDPNRPLLSYTASKVEGPDAVVVEASDGVNTAQLTVPLTLVDKPPVITCDSLRTPVNTPLLIPSTNCATDPNGDQITYNATGATNGRITGVSSPALTYTPDTGFAGTDQVQLTAGDGELSVTRTVPIYVTGTGASSVTIAGANSRTARINQPMKFSARPASATASAKAIRWNFGDSDTSDGERSDHGATAYHLYSHPGTYRVTAQVGDGPPSAPVTVVAQKPPLQIADTSLFGSDTLKLVLQLNVGGTLQARLTGASGVKAITVKLKKGRRTLRMRLPASVRQRGTVVVSFSLSLPAHGVDRLHRAVLLPRR
jgi:hypothetical protein